MSPKSNAVKSIFEECMEFYPYKYMLTDDEPKPWEWYMQETQVVPYIQAHLDKFAKFKTSTRLKNVTPDSAEIHIMVTDQDQEPIKYYLIVAEIDRKDVI